MPKTFLFRLRDKLLLGVALLVAGLMAGVLFTLDARLTPVGVNALAEDLERTRRVFESFVEERTANLSDKATLIAGLPRLTAALDEKKPKFDAIAATVTELCLDLNETVRAPFFLVTDAKGRVLFNAFHIPEVNKALAEGREPDPTKMKLKFSELADGWPNVAKALKGQGSKGGFLYKLKGEDPKAPEKELAFQTVTRPIESRGRTLGVLILGFALDDALAGQMKGMTESEVAFSLQKKVFGSTWAGAALPELTQSLLTVQVPGNASAVPAMIGPEKYLCLFSPISGMAGEKLGDFVLLRSLDKALAVRGTIRKTILFVGAIGLVLAFAAALFLSQRITAPVNVLLKGVDEVGKGNLTTRVEVKTHDELGVLARSFNEMTAGLADKERVTNLLGKYVAPQVAKKLLSNQGNLGLAGERRECVVMFTDIRGFTAFSENMAPEKLVAELNEYFTQMVDVVFEHEGTLDKFIGDAIMAVWGAPVPFEDKELRAVKCALKMQDTLRMLSVVRVSKGQAPLSMGIGLNCGVVVSGNLGSDKRTDYTVIGEEVNLASRLCSKAAPSQVLISESMFRKLKGLVEMKALPPVELKGFTEPVKIYEALGIEKA